MDQTHCGYNVETAGQNLQENYMLGLKGLQKLYFAYLILSAEFLCVQLKAQKNPVR